MNNIKHLVYIDVLSDGTPFYVGCGNIGRVSRTDRGRNPDHTKIIKSDLLWDRVVVFESYDRDLAFKKEAEVIGKIGRFDKGLGTLINKTDGGIGAKGAIQTQARKDAVSKRLKGVRQSDEHRANKAKSVKLAMNRPEVKEAIRLQQLEVQNRPEVKAKVKAGQALYFADPSVGVAISTRMRKQCADKEYMAKRTKALNDTYATGVPQAKIAAKKSARNVLVAEYCKSRGIPYSMKITNAQLGLL